MDKSISSDLIRGHIDTIILQSIFDDDKSVQNISDFIKEKSNNAYVINQATLYSSLKRLENNLFIKPYWHDCDNGRRKFYSITEKGKKQVKNELSQWNFSRDIIDKLINNSHSENKAININLSNNLTVNKNFAQHNDNNSNVNNRDNKSFNLQNLIYKTKLDERLDETTNYNFRSVLSSLIEKPKEKHDEILQSFENKHENKISLNSAIKENFEKVQKNNSNVDLSDIVLKEKKDGFKAYVSNKESRTMCGININKVKFVSSLFFILFFALEAFFIVYFNKNKLQLNFSDYLLPAFASFVPCLFSILLLIINPNKSSKRIKKDTIITTTVISFNLVLLVFVYNLIFPFDLDDFKLVVLRYVFPVALIIDLILYSIIKVLISKNRFFMIKSK